MVVSHHEGPGDKTLILCKKTRVLDLSTSPSLTSDFLRQVSSLNWEHQESSCLCLPRPAVTDTGYLPRLYAGLAELNSAPHVCVASSLLTKSSLRPQGSVS